jgi:hypothetical protein
MRSLPSLEAQGLRSDRSAADRPERGRLSQRGGGDRLLAPWTPAPTVRILFIVVAAGEPASEGGWTGTGTERTPSSSPPGVAPRSGRPGREPSAGATRVRGPPAAGPVAARGQREPVPAGGALPGDVPVLPGGESEDPSALPARPGARGTAPESGILASATPVLAGTRGIAPRGLGLRFGRFGIGLVPFQDVGQLGVAAGAGGLQLPLTDPLQAQRTAADAAGGVEDRDRGGSRGRAALGGRRGAVRGDGPRGGVDLLDDRERAAAIRALAVQDAGGAGVEIDVGATVGTGTGQGSPTGARSSHPHYVALPRPRPAKGPRPLDRSSTGTSSGGGADRDRSSRP